MVTLYNTSSTSLTLKWSHIQKHFFQGRPVGYKIVFYPVDLGSRDFNSVSVNYSTNTTTLTGLAVGTMYIVQVSAVSSGGVGPAKKTIAETGNIYSLRAELRFVWVRDGAYNRDGMRDKKKIRGGMRDDTDTQFLPVGMRIDGGRDRGKTF